MLKVDDLPRHVNRDGVYADHDKEERPRLPAKDVDNRVKKRQKQQAPAARPENERTRPDILYNRELESNGNLRTPHIAKTKADPAAQNQPEQFEPFRALAAQPFARQDAEQCGADSRNGR